MVKATGSECRGFILVHLKKFFGPTCTKTSLSPSNQLFRYPWTWPNLQWGPNLVLDSEIPFWLVPTAHRIKPKFLTVAFKPSTRCGIQSFIIMPLYFLYWAYFQCTWPLNILQVWCAIYRHCLQIHLVSPSRRNVFCWLPQLKCHVSHMVSIDFHQYGFWSQSSPLGHLHPPPTSHDNLTSQMQQCRQGFNLPFLPSHSHLHSLPFSCSTFGPNQMNYRSSRAPHYLKSLHLSTCSSFP